MVVGIIMLFGLGCSDRVFVFNGNIFLFMVEMLLLWEVVCIEGMEKVG